MCVYIESVLVGNIMIRRRECDRVLWSATEGVSSASFGVTVCVWEADVPVYIPVTWPRVSVVYRLTAGVINPTYVRTDILVSLRRVNH